MSDDILVDRLRSVYFTAMTQLPLYSFYHFLNYVASQIQETIEAKYISIYQKSLWSDQFKLVTEHFCQEHKPFLLDTTDKIAHTITQIEATDLDVQIPGYKVLTIPIYNNFQLKYFLIVIAPNQILSRKDAKILTEETQKFFTTIHNLLDSRAEKEKSEFLSRLSSRIYATPNLSKILKIVISDLLSFYSSFTYRILLSQDYEVEQDLPIQLIDYSDDAIKRASTRAFITGKIQIEEKTVEKNTCLYLPLTGKQGVYGVLQVVVPQVMRIPEQEIAFFRDVSKRVGQAIENASLYQTSHHLVRDLKLINKVSHQLNSNLKIAEIIPLVKEQLENIFKPHEIAFVYYEPDSENESFSVASKSSAFFKTQKGHEFIRFLSNKIKEDFEPIFSGDYTKTYPSLKHHSLIAIPMSHGNILQGFIVILHNEQSAFSFQNFQLAESIIQHSALAQANAILNEQLEQAVITDYLTKLYSRSYLDETIHMHMQMDEIGTLILFDIDDFKEINDTYGHHVGDRVIIQVAKILMDSCVKDSIPARWGGEELALYLPHYNAKDAVAVAETIRKKVKQNTKPKVTLSSGVATWQKGEQLSVNDLFIRSDKALYTAKNSGKNQVVVDQKSL